MNIRNTPLILIALSLTINGAMGPQEKTFTLVNATDKPIEIVYIYELYLWGTKGNRAIELNTGTYRRSILPGEVLRWNKIIGEQLTTQLLDPGKSIETSLTYRADPDTPVIAGPLWLVKDKLYRHADFINLLERMSRYKKVRLDAKPREVGFYRLTGE